MLRGLLIVSGILLVLLAFWTIVFFWRRRHTGGGWNSFRDWVRKPEWKASMSDYFAMREAAVEELSRRPPEELVEMLLDSDFDIARRAIEAGGVRMVPALLAAITDPRFRKPCGDAEQGGGGSLWERKEPLETVLDCLVPLAPEEAGPLVAPLVQDPSKAIRRQAARVIGAIGSDACVAPFAIACRDELHLATSAMIGIQRGEKAKRFTPRFRAAAFEAIVPWVDLSRGYFGDYPARCLLVLDRTRAIELLTSSQYMVAGSTALRMILSSLREADVIVNEGQLLGLASALECMEMDNRNNSALAEVYRLLGRCNSADAEAALQRGAASSSADVREGVAKARLTREGIDCPFEFAGNRWDEGGWESLSAPQRHVMAVRILIDQVNNGGISQFLINSSGRRWREAIEGFKAMGCSRDAEMFQQVADMFGPAGPSVDDDTRHKKLSELLPDDGDGPFEPLEKEFYEDRGGRVARLLEYALANAEHFREPGGTKAKGAEAEDRT
jgi:hypothetical protein